MSRCSGTTRAADLRGVLGAARLATMWISRLLRGTPWTTLLMLACVMIACAMLVRAGALPRAVLRVTAIAVAHGGMLTVAIAWAGPTARPARASPLPVLLVALGAGGAALHDVAAVAYLATPVWLARRAQRGHLVGLGLGSSVSRPALALGTLIGIFLGAHVLVSATLTFGYRPLEHGMGPVLAAVAYDVGAQVPATELFFRGALYNRAQRERSFGLACALATVASVGRYLVDPLLPPAVELIAGAAFYMTLVGIANAWLLWRFGTLVPGLVVSALVFLAYRILIAA